MKKKKFRFLSTKKNNDILKKVILIFMFKKYLQHILYLQQSNQSLKNQSHPLSCKGKNPCQKLSIVMDNSLVYIYLYAYFFLTLILLIFRQKNFKEKLKSTLIFIDFCTVE